MVFGPNPLDDSKESYSVTFVSMPETCSELLSWVDDAVSDYQGQDCEVVVGLEKVGGFMGNEAGESGGNRNRASGHTMFAFGQGYGRLECALAASGFDRGDAGFHDVTPQAWQKTCGVKRAKGETKAAFKTRLLNRAHELFPRTKFTKATCDAALIAWHMKQIYKGGPA